MKVIIVGGGTLVFFLTRSFIEKGYDVTIIVKNPRSVIRYEKQRTFKVRIIPGDGTDIKVLEEAGAKEAELLVAVTDHDYINLSCCRLGDLIFNIPNTLAVVNNPRNYDIYRKLGVKYIFNKTSLIVSILERSTESICATPILEYSDGKLLLYEIRMTYGMRAIGKEIYKINFPPGVRILGILRNGVFEPNENHFVLQENDDILLASYPSAISSTIRLLCS
jgi:trk system potassium uptake protein